MVSTEHDSSGDRDLDSTEHDSSDDLDIEIEWTPCALYNFLYRCAVEQTGQHTLNLINKHPQNSIPHDETFLKPFLSEALKDEHYTSNPSALAFLQQFPSTDFEIHLTRDCQIIETGTHYVFLTLRSKHSTPVKFISFAAKFKQSWGELPVPSELLYIRLVDECSPEYAAAHHTQQQHIRRFGTNKDGQRYERVEIDSRCLSIHEPILRNLPTISLAKQNNEPIQLQKIPDACLLM